MSPENSRKLDNGKIEAIPYLCELVQFIFVSVSEYYFIKNGLKFTMAVFAPQGHGIPNLSLHEQIRFFQTKIEAFKMPNIYINFKNVKTHL